MAFNSDAYIADLVARGWSRTDAVNSARYEAQAQAYAAPTTVSSTTPPAGSMQPTVTIGGAPAGYAPITSMQPTVTIGGAPAGYTETVTPNYITGAGVPGTPGYQAPTTPNYITGAGVTTTNIPPKQTTTDSDISKEDRDAFALLEQTFRDYGLSELVPVIKG